MKRFLTNLSRPLLTVTMALAMLGSIAFAGSLTPSGVVSSTMHSLAEIYDAIAGTFNSSAIVADQNGSLIQNLKYIEQNVVWASGSSNIWNLNGGNVGIGTTTPETKLEVVGAASISGALQVTGTTTGTTIRAQTLSGPRPADPDFTIVVFPDTQNMVNYAPAMWETMAPWVVTNKTTENIQAVIGLGDVTDTHSGAAFTEALTGWDAIKSAGIPYVPIIGNHDYDTNATRDTTSWNTYFGTGYFTGQSWFGGAYNDLTENYYAKLTIGSHKYLILALEFFPRTAVLTWAQSIIDASPDREVIVVTHAYLNNDGTRTRHGDLYSPDTYGLAADNDGQQIWDTLIKGNSNIIAVLSGHQICSPTSAYSPAVGTSGNLVHQFFADYQCSNSGNGNMVLMKFRPSLGKIDVSTYSPFTSSFDATGAYTLAYSGVNLDTAVSTRFPVMSSGDLHTSGALSTDSSLLVIGSALLGTRGSSVGVGTMVPTATLHVVGNAPTLFNVASGSNSRFAVLENGNVGIGTASPTTKLDIAGSASVSGNFELTGYISSNWLPRLDSAYALGDSTHRWANLFTTNASASNNLEISGTASISGLTVANSLRLSGSLVQNGSLGLGSNNLVTSVLSSGKKERYAGNNGIGQSRPAYYNIDQSDAITGTRDSNTQFTRTSGAWVASALVGQYAFFYVAAAPNTGVWLPITANTTTTLTVTGSITASANTVKTSPWNPITQTYPHGQGGSAFIDGVFDGENVWLMPYGSLNLVKVNPATGAMTNYPHGLGAFTAGAGGVFDGTNIWMIAFGTNLVKIDPTTGTMTNYPTGRANAPFVGGVFDGTNIWLIPFGSADLVKFNPATGASTSYPHGQTQPPTSFAGGVFDGESIWLVPDGSPNVIKVNPTTGAMTSYPHGIAGLQLFAGGVFDGENIWLIPRKSPYLVKINPTTGAMTMYAHGQGTNAFYGGVFDGESIWLIPLDSPNIVKVNPATGAMTTYAHGQGTGAFRGGVFDGENVWLIPHNSGNLVRMRPPRFGREALFTPGTLSVGNTVSIVGDASTLLNVSSGSNSRFSVLESGNVGVGTLTPDSKLDIAGNILASASGNVSLILKSTSATGTDGQFTILTASTSDRLDFRGGAGAFANTLMSIASNGNVGIGATNIDAKFEIQANTFTTSSIASLSATSLAGGSVFNITVPASSSANNPHGLMLVQTTAGATIASWSMGGTLSLRGKIMSHGAVATCTGTNTDTTGCVDYAESYPTSDPTLQAGELVAVDPLNPSHVVRAQTSDLQPPVILGIVSTNPAALIDGNAFKTGAAATELVLGNVPVALAGRVPLYISDENGPILSGDHLTISATKPGYAMKMTSAGMSVGIALEPSDANREPSQIMAFVNLSYWAPDTSKEAMGGVASSSEGSGDWLQKTFQELFASIVSAFKSLLGIGFEQGKIQTGEVQVQKMCVGATCVTEGQLLQLLEKNGLVPTSEEVNAPSTSSSAESVIQDVVSPPSDDVPVDTGASGDSAASEPTP